MLYFSSCKKYSTLILGWDKFSGELYLFSVGVLFNETIFQLPIIKNKKLSEMKINTLVRTKISKKPQIFLRGYKNETNAAPGVIASLKQFFIPQKQQIPIQSMNNCLHIKFMIK